MLAILAGKLEAKRRTCAPLAGKSTLNQLEPAPSEPSRYHKVGHDPAAIDGLFVDLFLDAHKTPPERIPSISTPPTTPCTATGTAASSTAITTATAICHCTSSADDTCLRPSSDARTSTPPPVERGRTNRRSNPKALAQGRDPAPRRPRRADGVVRSIAEPLAEAEAESLAQGGPARRFADTPGARSTAGAASGGRRQGRAPAHGFEPALRRDLAQRRRNRRPNPL